MKSRAQTPPRVLIYLRVSTDEQVQSGAGIAAQLHACKDWVRKESLEVLAIVEEDEGVSGATPPARRLKLMEGVGLMRRGDVLLVAKRDRIMRDIVQVGAFELVLTQQKMRLASAAGEGTAEVDPEDIGAVIGQIVLRTMTDLFAQVERMMTKARTRDALRAKRRRGERAGSGPYGYELYDDGKRSKVKTLPNGQVAGGLPIGLREHPGERAVIDWIIDRRDRHGTPWRAIAGILANQGTCARSGKPFDHSTVRHLYKIWRPIRVPSESAPQSDPPADLPTRDAG